MWRLLLAPILVAAVLAAQPISRDEIVARLTSDLLALKLAVASDEPLKDDVYTPAELQSVETYSQSQAMKAFEKDLMKFRFQHRVADPKPANGRIEIRSLINPDLEYKLAFVLTGKELSAVTLSPLVEALVSISESAEVCSNTRTRLQNSAEFRSSAENARDALQGAGVRTREVHIVMDALFRGAIRAASPQPTFKYQ